MAGSLKIDRLLDWCSAVSGRNYHLKHRRYVGLPNRRTPTEHLFWIQDLVAQVENEFSEQCPDSVSLNYHDVRRWKSRYPELFVADAAVDVCHDLREFLGLDPVTLANYSGYVASLALRRVEVRFNELDANSPEFNFYLKSIDKLCGRLCTAAETISRIKASESHLEGLESAYEAGCNIIALSKADPHATPQMRQWMEHLIMAALEKLEH